MHGTSLQLIYSSLKNDSGGSEWQKDYSNLPDYYMTFYRNYDAALGRFVAVDPMAEGKMSMSPYHYAGNSPMQFNDPLGNLARPAPPTDAGPSQPVIHLHNGVEDILNADANGGAAVDADGNVIAPGSMNASGADWYNQGAFDDNGSFSRDKGRAGYAFWAPAALSSPGTTIENIYHAGDGTDSDPHTGMATTSIMGYLRNVVATGKVGTISNGYLIYFKDDTQVPGGVVGNRVRVNLGDESGQGGPDINWGLSTDPNSFNLKKIGNSYVTEVIYNDIWYGFGAHFNVKMNFNVSVNVKGRLTPDGDILNLNKLAARLALAATFDNARKLTYDEWQAGDVNPLNLMERFLGNLNWSLNRSPFLSPAYAQPVKPGGWNGVPTSVIRYDGLFIFW